MSLVQVRYTRTYTPDNSGVVPTFARPTFTLSGPIDDGISQTVIPSAIVCTVDALGRLVGPDGTVGVLLYAVDLTSTGAAVQPVGRTYSVSGEPVTPSWTFGPLKADSPTADLATKGP